MEYSDWGGIEKPAVARPSTRSHQFVQPWGTRWGTPNWPSENRNLQLHTTDNSGRRTTLSHLRQAALAYALSARNGHQMSATTSRRCTAFWDNPRLSSSATNAGASYCGRAQRSRIPLRAASAVSAVSAVSFSSIRLRTNSSTAASSESQMSGGPESIQLLDSRLVLPSCLVTDARLVDLYDWQYASRRCTLSWPQCAWTKARLGATYQWKSIARLSPPLRGG
jgi:hypothetical protein